MLSRHDSSAHDASHNVERFNSRKITLLQKLLSILAAQGYRFTTVTPLTHERYISYSEGSARDLKDVFGWSLPFEENILPPLVLELMANAELLTNTQGLLKSKIRISSLDNDLFIHSAFPTSEVDSVFFGPDTYRFARFIKQSLRSIRLPSAHADPLQAIRILDVGCGSGAGGVAAVRALPQQQPFHLTLNDINDRALTYAVASTQASGVEAEFLHGDFFSLPQNEYDLIVSNPPYIVDSEARLYRDGGGLFGLDLSLRIARHALQLLAPGGCLLLYTGVAMTRTTVSPLIAELTAQLNSGTYRWSYEEIDPDVFGEELQRPEYHGVSRIAAVGLVVQRDA